MRLLIPLDGSARAEAVLAYVIELARDTRARVELLRTTVPGPFEKRGARECREYLAGVAERLAADGIRDLRIRIWEGDPTGAILRAARRHRVDLIVMTTHGRGGLNRLIFGSVTEGVLRRTRTPVLVVPPPDPPADWKKEPDAYPIEPS